MGGGETQRVPYIPMCHAAALQGCPVSGGRVLALGHWLLPVNGEATETATQLPPFFFFSEDDKPSHENAATVGCFAMIGAIKPAENKNASHRHRHMDNIWDAKKGNE